MALIDGRTWLEHLSTDECWQLVESSTIGRVAVLVDSAPEIYPVNYAAVDGGVVIRTDPGTKLRGLDRSPSVCFEVDGVDAQQRLGWSVMIKGRARVLTDPAELAAAEALDLEPWALGDKLVWIEIEATQVTGRRIHQAYRRNPPPA
ncbi:MAG: pyridoxamine 5'-phosphate oxidase family protein [Acidimicrobiia bacterium]